MVTLRSTLGPLLAVEAGNGSPITTPGSKYTQNTTANPSRDVHPSNNSASESRILLEGDEKKKKKMMMKKMIKTETNISLVEEEEEEQVCESDHIYLLEHPILLAPVSFVDSSVGFATTVTIPTGTYDLLEETDAGIAIIAPCFGICMMQSFDGRCVRDDHCLRLTNSI